MAQLTKTDVAKLPKEELVDSYLALRESAKANIRNTKDQVVRATKDVAAFLMTEQQREKTLLGIDAVGVGASALLAGHIIGSAEREIEAGDPDASTTIGGKLPKDAALGLAFVAGTVGLANVEMIPAPTGVDGKPLKGARPITWGDVLKPMAMGSAAAYLSRWAQERARNGTPNYGAAEDDE